MRPATSTLLILLILIVTAAGLRLYHLGTIPAGLHHDEASNGLLAQDILAGERPVFFSTYTGKEAAYMYLVAAAIKGLGKTPLAIRLPAALCGVILVPAMFVLGKRILGSTAGGLLTAGATAGAPWLLHLNRIGFRANLLPLLLTLWVWLLLRAMGIPTGTSPAQPVKASKPHHFVSWGWWVGAGGVLGGVAYTYTSSRIVPLLVCCYLGYLVLCHRTIIHHRVWMGFLVMVLTASVVALPLFLHFLHHPQDWSERLEQIGVCVPGMDLSACGLTTIEHAWATFLMVGVRGDPLGFFNLPGEPALPLAVGWLFYVGIVLAVWRIREPVMALLLFWWGVMVLPGILSRDSPHFLRTIGAAPPTMLLWALPLTTLMQWQPVPGRHHGALLSIPRLMPMMAGFAVLLLVVNSTYGYFGRWARRPELYYEYMGYATDAASIAASVAGDTDLVISEEYYRHPTYLFLAPRTAQARWFDARYGVPWPDPHLPTRYLISAATPVDPRINAFLWGARGENVLNGHGQYAATMVTVAHAQQFTAPEPTIPLTATIGMVTFAGATIGPLENPTSGASDTFDPAHPSNSAGLAEIPSGQGALLVTLFWQVHAATQQELRVFLHLIGADGTKIAQHDTLGYPSREWRQGDRFATFHTIPLPPQVVLDQGALYLGIYDVVTGERLPIAGGKRDDHALVIPIKQGGTGS